MAVTQHVVVRYTLRSDRVAEHEALVAGVFAELAERAPAGVDYRVLRMPDGLSYVHVAAITAASAAEENPLTSLPAFRAFSAGVADRCTEGPTSSVGTLLGAYAPGVTSSSS